MIIKGIISEDFVNYKKPSLVIEFPYCDFKCEKECGELVCQNNTLVRLPDIEISIEKIVDEYYLNNPITKAIVFQGLEPLDSFIDVLEAIKYIRKKTTDDIVIYTGYTKEELIQKKYLNLLKNYDNIVIKYGRFIPNRKSIFDIVLGVELSSENQYAERL